MMYNILPPYPFSVYCSVVTTACFLLVLLAEPFLPIPLAHYLVYCFGLVIPLLQIAYLLYGINKRPFNFRNLFPFILNGVVIVGFLIKYSASFSYSIR